MTEIACRRDPTLTLRRSRVSEQTLFINGTIKHSRSRTCLYTVILRACYLHDISLSLSLSGMICDSRHGSDYLETLSLSFNLLISLATKWRHARFAPSLNPRENTERNPLRTEISSAIINTWLDILYLQIRKSVSFAFWQLLTGSAHACDYQRTVKNGKKNVWWLQFALPLLRYMALYRRGKEKGSEGARREWLFDSYFLLFFLLFFLVCVSLLAPLIIYFFLISEVRQSNFLLSSHTFFTELTAECTLA